MDDTNLILVDWHMQFDRNNQTYRMLMDACWLAVKSLLQTQANGTTRLADSLDEQCMSRLCEKFILEYYHREHPELTVIDWALDDDLDDMLPAMHSNIMLTYESTVLIIDAKYYAHAMQQQFDKRSIHSGNLYQIFTYMKSKEAKLAGVLHEMPSILLYTRTDEEIQPDCVYHMSGNRISVLMLDLDRPFKEIRRQLD